MPLGNQVAITTANGNSNGWASKISVIQIGTLEIYNVEAIILEQLDNYIASV